MTVLETYQNKQDNVAYLRVQASVDDLALLASIDPDLLTISPEANSDVSDERQGWIVAGNITGGSTLCSPNDPAHCPYPHYRDWLSSRGLLTNLSQQEVAVLDVGFDNGKAPGDPGHHPDFETSTCRLEGAGAILVGALNMGEYAYDFTGENVHDGDCRNPHDFRRMSGGSSSGSGSAVGGGLVPLALGSDTNGSIRVPASFCGVFGLKPTYGRLSRAHSFPFVASLDHVGPLARSTHDLALAYDAMQGHDRDDPACADRPVERVMPLIDRGIEGLRIAVAGGYFREGTFPEAQTALARVAAALGANAEIELPEAARARAAAYVITASEGGTLHLDRLRKRARDFDPAVRDRLIAGAMTPAALVVKAQKFRRWYRARVLELFAKVDAVLAPATPCAAPLIGQKTFVLDGVELPLRANIGVYTQPISFIGLPVVTVPVPLAPLPIGVQIIAAPWREDIALRIAQTLEQMGVVAAPRPSLEK
jgi:aspartyl-tRNA(Asn)/glutamyl-tRNA(Gln) amidotransferase subunit A